MAKKMATKVLFCLVVIAILMSTIPVSVSASDTGDTVIFEGEVTRTGGIIGFTYWDVNVDVWLRGSLIYDEIYVILDSRDPWGSYDSNIRVGDSVQVYGVVNPRGEDPPFCTVGLNGLSYYIKKIGAQEETKPNLVIESISPDIANPKKGDEIEFTVEIKNKGEGDAEDFYIYYYLDNEYIHYNHITNGLDAGNTIRDFFFLLVDDCGEFQVNACVDKTNKVDEGSNEGDNTKIYTVKADCGESVERALIIGISDYKDKEVKDFGQQPVNAAKGMYNLLRWGYGYERENIVLLRDEEATYAKIIDETKRLGSETDRNDKFVFYYTGHGAKNEKFETEGIVPYDVKVKDGEYAGNNYFYEVTTLFDSSFEGDFKGSLIAIFDTCYSGGFSKDTDIDGDRSGIDGDKRVVLMSARADETQSPSLHHSQLYFTKYLIDAFASHSNEADRNDDRQVSVEEAFKFAECRGWFGILQHPQIMDHYPDKSNREAELHISNELVVDEIISGEGGSSVHIHAYDAEGKHVGTADSGNIVSEIPGAWYSGPASHPEEIIIFGISEDITFTIEGQIDETFNFTVRQFTDVNDIIVNYDDVPIKENAVATVAVSKTNPTYTMEIDNNGDGTTDYTNEPDSIETIGGVSETKTCKVQITTNPSLQDRPSIVYVNGNYYIAYQSHEKGYGIYIKEFDSNWEFKKKVEVASGSAYYDSPSLLFANNKLYVAYITNANGANANDYDVIVKEYNPSSLSCTKGAKYLTSLQSCHDLPALYYKDGYFYMAYQSWEKGDGDIFIKKFDSDLNMLKKVQVTTKSSLQDRPSITYANGYIYVAYFSEETGYYDIFVKRLDNNLNLASWKEQITTKSSYQSYPFITFVNNQFVISYASTESGTLGIYMKKYDSNWNFIEKTEVIDSLAYERRPSHTWDGSNFWVAYVYNQDDSKDWNIFALRPDLECGSVPYRGLE